MNEQSAQLEKQILGMVGLNLSLREIGRRVGRSHERVRQILEQRGVTSGAQWKRKAGWAEKKCLEYPLYERFTETLFERGIDWSVIVSDSSGNPLTTQLLVRGKLVKLCVAIVGNDGYIHLHSRRVDRADVYAVYIADYGWLVFPKETMPMRGTMFSLTPRISGRGDARHDYASYLNKWEIFTEVK